MRVPGKARLKNDSCLKPAIKIADSFPRLVLDFFSVRSNWRLRSIENRKDATPTGTTITTSHPKSIPMTRMQMKSTYFVLGTKDNRYSFWKRQINRQIIFSVHPFESHGGLSPKPWLNKNTQHRHTRVNCGGDGVSILTYKTDYFRWAYSFSTSRRQQ